MQRLIGKFPRWWGDRLCAALCKQLGSTILWNIMELLDWIIKRGDCHSSKLNLNIELRKRTKIIKVDIGYVL